MRDDYKCKRISNFFLTIGMYQLIRENTRVTDTSTSIIDHAYVSHPNEIRQVKVHKLGWSDHFPICLVFKRRFTVKQEHFYLTYRSFKHFNEAKFLNDLSTSSWNTIESSRDDNDVDYMLDLWYQLFFKVVDKHLPINKRRVKYPTQPEWLSEEILNAMKIRDGFALSRDIPQWRLWKNKVTKLITDAKTSHYTALLSTCKSDPKGFWKILNDLIPKKSSPAPPSVIIDDNAVSEPMLIAEEFNDYFSNLPSQFQQVSMQDNWPEFSSLSNFVIQKVPADHYFEIQPLTPEFVLSELQTLKITAAGLDNIGPKILKIASPVIAPSLSKVLNASIKSGKFPARCKEAKIICLHKSGDSSNKSNFRPISLLPMSAQLKFCFFCTIADYNESRIAL